MLYGYAQTCILKKLKNINKMRQGCRTLQLSAIER